METLEIIEALHGSDSSRLRQDQAKFQMILRSLDSESPNNEREIHTKARDYKTVQQLKGGTVSQRNQEFPENCNTS